MIRKTIVTASLVLMLIMTAICTAGCGTDDIDISGYADREIAIAGLEGGDKTVTVADLKGLDCVTKKTHSTSDKIGEVRATGPLLSTLLEQYGVSIEDVKRIHFYGEDEYDIKLTGDYLKDHDLILAFGIDGEPLDEESVPLRLIIPESDSAYWIRMINRIEIGL